MRAIGILREALFATLRNWRQAIRIFLVPLCLVICVFAGAMIFGRQSFTIEGQKLWAPRPSLFLLLPLFLFLLFWPVVAWHRLLVLDDQPKGFAPPIRLKAVLRYVLNFFGLGILMALLMIPIFAIIGPVMISRLEPEVISGGEMPPLTFFIWPTLASIPALYLGIRFCLILPGAAVENHVGLAGSWSYTSDQWASLLLIVLIGATFSIAFQVFVSAAAPTPVEASQNAMSMFQVALFIGQMFGSLFVISVMSTMFLNFVPNDASD